MAYALHAPTFSSGNVYFNHSLLEMSNSSSNQMLVNDRVICYSPNMITTSGFWKGDNPLNYALPLFILQLVIVVLTTRILYFCLRPFRQPRVIAEIIGGIVLGPSLLGRIKGFPEVIFPKRSHLLLSTVAHLGLVLFIFLIGVETDASSIRRTGRRSLVIAISGMALPFFIGTLASFLFHRQISHNISLLPFVLFLGVALSSTAFPVLARILAEAKLINTDLGRTAMSAAIFNDTLAWIVLALCISLSDPRATSLYSVWVLLSGAAFVLVCFYVLRPAARWAFKRSSDSEGVTDMQLSAIVVSLMMAALATDAIGVNVVFGAFVFGLAVPPNRTVSKAIVEKLEDIVTGLLLPLFFAFSGLRTNATAIKDPLTASLLLLVFILASAAKIAGTALASSFHSMMPLRDGLELGFLMNARGLLEMIVLNIGRDREVLDEESFAVMVLASVGMTALVTPVIASIHRRRTEGAYKRRRTLEHSRYDTEQRVLACIHCPRHVSPLLTLLSLSHPTKHSPIFLYALQLTELTGRASTLLAASSSAPSSPSHPSSTPAVLFRLSSPPAFISIHPLSAASPFPSMHLDVASVAEEKRASLVLLPFHKHLAVDGGLQAAPNPGPRSLNINVLASAPCSVALLVDRGVAALASTPRRVAILFFGGPHDREALCFAWRMADDPRTSLSLIHFLTRVTRPRSLSIVTDSGIGDREKEEEERVADEELLSAFRRKYAGNERVGYGEMLVESGEAVVAAVREIESEYDLYVAGRGQIGAAARMMAGLTEWAECPELGPMGDLLVSSDFTGVTSSVVVVQQYVGDGEEHRAFMRQSVVGRESTMADGMSPFEIDRDNK